MNINQDGSWEQIHQHILSLYKKYAKCNELDSHSIFPSLYKLSSAKLHQKDSSFLLATVRTEEGERIAGFAITTNYGQDIGLIIVHPLYRNMGIGTQLLSRQLIELGTVCYQVPMWNKAAVKMCFNSGLIATQMITFSKHYSFLIMEASHTNFKAATTIQ
ncbi:GNAT family N-acetyltransferase [Paenibacillus turicensis]|uniref:GNAT family N-acetyltransferase n=1 Tax=Paenibacillus turicensis TaxID=160487 RepID=UPI003D27EB84